LADKRVFAVGFGLYAVGQGIQFLIFIFSGRDIFVVLASLGAMCFGAAISAVLFGGAELRRG
jgi:hypothetical protein